MARLPEAHELTFYGLAYRGHSKMNKRAGAKGRAAAASERAPSRLTLLRYVALPIGARAPANNSQAHNRDGHHDAGPLRPAPLLAPFVSISQREGQ